MARPIDLLKYAQRFGVEQRPTDISPTVETLAIAWMKGKITVGQAEAALSKAKLIHSKGTSVYILLARALRQACAKGRIRTSHGAK